MKKILALAIVAVMVFACTFAASAATESRPDYEAAGFWGAHSNGIEINEDGVEVTFTNKTYETYVNDAGETLPTENWHALCWVLYSDSDHVMNEGDYVEYWVQRADNYGWVGGVNRWSGDDALAGVGITYSVDETNADWANFAANLRAGVDGKITAVREGNVVTVVMDLNGVVSTVKATVAADVPVYLSLTGDCCTVSNIKVITPDPENTAPTGDLIVLPIALLCISAGAVLTLKKKVG